MIRNNRQVPKTIYNYDTIESDHVIISANICNSMLMDLLTAKLRIKAYIIDLYIKLYTNPQLLAQDVILGDLYRFHNNPYCKDVLLYLSNKMMNYEHKR